MLLHDDVVTDRQAEPGAFSGRFGCEEWIEHLFLHFRGMPVPLSRILFPRDHRGSWLLPLRWARSRRHWTLRSLGRRVKAIGNQIQQNPRDVLWENVNLASIGIKRLFQLDIETLLLGARPVIGEIEALPRREH